MGIVKPVYTPKNVQTAYQLNWSLSVFWRKAPPHDEWLSELAAICETDGVRILSHRFATSCCSLFFVSTRPELQPSAIPGSIKGRLQHLVRNQFPRAFQRNYDLHSIGSTQLEKVESYVAAQLRNHLSDDSQTQASLCDLQLINAEVDLSQPQFTAHARYRCNLHLVVVRNWRVAEDSIDRLIRVRSIIRKTSQNHGHLLSHLGLVPDHMHLVLGFQPSERPIDIALSYMNNISFVYGLQPILMHSCFLGTIGEYDRGAIRNPD